MVILSFIGATMVVYNLGYVTGVLDNIFEVLDRIAYDKNYQVVGLLVYNVQNALRADSRGHGGFGHLSPEGEGQSQEKAAR